MIKIIRKNTWISIGVCLLMSSYPGNGLAATDGTLGPDSTGTQGVSLSIANLVRITGMENINFGKYSGTGNLASAVDICIWTNQSAGNYRVTASGNGQDGVFTLSNGSGGVLPYGVRWNTSIGTSGNFVLNAGVITSALSGANTASSNCGGGRNANFQVTIEQEQLLARRPGIYTGVLTFVVAP